MIRRAAFPYPMLNHLSFFCTGILVDFVALDLKS